MFMKKKYVQSIVALIVAIIVGLTLGAMINMKLSQNERYRKVIEELKSTEDMAVEYDLDGKAFLNSIASRLSVHTVSDQLLDDTEQDLQNWVKLFVVMD